MFFHFNLLCQRLEYFCFANATAIFLPFLYCFLPFAPFLCFWDISLFALWKFTRFFILCCFIRCLFGAVFALFQYLFVSTAVFLPFLYCFLPFCLLPFAIWDISPFALWNFARCFLILGCFIRCLFGAVFAFRNVCLFQQRLSYLFYIVFCPLPLSFAFETFCALPFGSLPVVFLFSVVSFAVFWGQYSLFFNVCLFQLSFPYLFVYCFLPFAPFLCFWDISLFALFNFTNSLLPFTSPLLLFSFFFVCGIHLLRYF